MLKKIIRKALLLNNVLGDDIFAIKIQEHQIVVHIFKIIVLLLYNFALKNNISANEIFEFIMKNFEKILDVTVTEIEIAMLNFSNLYENKAEKIIELHNKDECLIVLTIQENLNKKLEMVRK